MLKISLAILMVYLLYYAGNILYDVFLKKGNKDKTEELEEFSLSEISNEKEVSNIRIEDVENLNTPKSFNKSPIQKVNNENTEERPSLEQLRQLFEAEQDLDGENFTQENSSENKNQTSTEEQGFSKQNDKKEQPDTNKVTSVNSTDKSNNAVHSKDWKTLLNLSETLVQLVANHDGYKVYHSVM